VPETTTLRKRRRRPKQSTPKPPPSIERLEDGRLVMTQDKLDAIIRRRVMWERSHLVPKAEMADVYKQALGDTIARLNRLEDQVAELTDVRVRRTTLDTALAEAAGRVALVP
jgi:hypothetical protein